MNPNQSKSAKCASSDDVACCNSRSPTALGACCCSPPLLKPCKKARMRIDYFYWGGLLFIATQAMYFITDILAFWGPQNQKWLNSTTIVFIAASYLFLVDVFCYIMSWVQDHKLARFRLPADKYYVVNILGLSAEVFNGVGAIGFCISTPLYFYNSDYALQIAIIEHISIVIFFFDSILYFRPWHAQYSYVKNRRHLHHVCGSGPK